MSRGRDWRHALARTCDEEATKIATLRPCHTHGASAGQQEFVKGLESTFGRKLAKRTGRPRKTRAAAGGEKW